MRKLLALKTSVENMNHFFKDFFFTSLMTLNDLKNYNDASKSESIKSKSSSQRHVACCTMPVQIFNNFLSAEEADLINEVISVNSAFASDDDCINGVLPRIGDSYAKRLETDSASDIGWTASEKGNVRYSCRWGGVVEPHRDWMEPNKLWVLLIYCNDVCEGQTVFHCEEQMVVVQPVKGRAVLFDAYILHEARAPVGRKAILTCDLIGSRTE